jgi:uncharacterized RDD family membrane protein YckC
MIWIKSVLAGLAAAILTVVAIVIATTRISMTAGSGTGGIGAVSFGLSELLLIPFVLAFALGFRWTFRRQRRRLL